jgi:hypothetical protein
MVNMSWAREAGFSAGFLFVVALIPLRALSCPYWDPRCFGDGYRVVLPIRFVLPSRKASARLKRDHSSPVASNLLRITSRGYCGDKACDGI